MPTRNASNPHKTNIHVYRCNQRLCSYFVKLNRCEVAPIVATHHNQNVRGTNNEQKCSFITLSMQSNEDVHEESLPREDIHGRANAIDPATPAKRDGPARRQSPNSRMLSDGPARRQSPNSRMISRSPSWLKPRLLREQERWMCAWQRSKSPALPWTQNAPNLQLSRGHKKRPNLPLCRGHKKLQISSSPVDTKRDRISSSPVPDALRRLSSTPVDATLLLGGTRQTKDAERIMNFLLLLSPTTATRQK